MTIAPPATATALSVERLGVSYGAVRAASDISLSVGAGCCVALVGANGAGKTSILRGISGLTPTRPGSAIRLGDRVLTRMDPDRRARAGLAHVLEGRHVFANLSVRHNLELGAVGGGGGASAIADAIEDVLTMLPELVDKLDHAAGTLSGGQQQMLAIGRALAGRPEVVLMDEPTNGLAPILVERVVEIIRLIADRNMAVLLVEQRLEVAQAVGERVHILQRGRLIDETAGDDPRLPELVHGAYLS